MNVAVDRPKKPAARKLERYRDKRDFERTPEPSGHGPAPKTGEPDPALRFVVQRHRARRLHYDLRFEIDGVLASWAVPKGPTLDPDVKRGAYHVEDHPLEYIDFEGVIPAGGYGGGDVIVWDTGTWQPVETDDPGRAVAKGELHADVFGEKLRGRFVLIRTKRDDAGKDDWLLLHKHDEFAVKGWDPEAHERSVLSGRTNDEVKADPDRLWRSNVPAAEASVTVKSTDVQAADPQEIAALDELGASGKWRIFGRELRVTNLDKELFPSRGREAPLTKRDFLRYAAQIAPVAQPYLAGRALNMHRFPNGAQAKGFWHKELPAHAPAWLPRWHNPEAGADESRTYLVVDEPAALVWAANFGALEWHAWTSMTDEPRSPTWALIDIDPGERTTWDDVLTLARLHRTALEHLRITSFPKVTGRRGIQIWIPITRGPSFEQTRRWVKKLSESVGQVVPELVSWKWGTADRSGLARLDYTQNAVNKTLVAPYSCRAAAGAPVSVPIAWEELDDPALRPDGFGLRTVMKRVAARGDLMRPALRVEQALPPL